MKRETYKEMAATAQGRKELHETMLNEIKTKFETLVNGCTGSQQRKSKSDVWKRIRENAGYRYS